MSKPITISVPDELFERLEALGSSLNRSRVCQAALRQAVDRLELRGRRRDEGIDVLVDRLAEQMAPDKQESFDAGYETGSDYAKTWADLRDLRKLARQSQSFNQPGAILNAVDWPENTRDYLEGADLDLDLWHEDAFWRGFASGAVETYRKAMELLEKKKHPKEAE
jgi:hypothetical protein